MGTAGILLAVAMCCGAPDASAQLYLNIGGPGSGNASSQGSPTANLGIGGPGSATELQGLNEPVIGSNRGISLPLLNQQAGKPLGVAQTLKSPHPKRAICLEPLIHLRQRFRTNPARPSLSVSRPGHQACS